MSDRYLRFLLSAFSLSSLLLIWWAAALWFDDPLLPPPSAVLDVVEREVASGDFEFQIGITLWRVFASFILAMFAGMMLGWLMGRFRHVDWVLDSWLIFFLNIPALVVIILAYVWMGLTEAAGITAVAINKIPNVAVMIREGVRTLDPELQEMARVFRFGHWKTIRHVVLPEMAPYIAAASRSGIALIWKIVLVVELLGRSNGVGFQLHLYFQLFDIAGIIAWGLTFIIIMQCVEWLILRPFEGWANRWRVGEKT